MTGPRVDGRRFYQTPQFILGAFLVAAATLIAIVGYSPGRTHEAHGLEAYIRATLIGLAGVSLIVYSILDKSRRSMSWTLVAIISVFLLVLDYLSKGILSLLER